MWKSYIGFLSQQRALYLHVKQQTSVNHNILKILRRKEKSKTVVENNKSTNSFAGLVANGIGLDLARGLTFAFRLLT